MSETLLAELDGALMIRYIKGITWAWHGGTYVNAYNETGKCLAKLSLTEEQLKIANPAMVEEILLSRIKENNE